MSKYIILILGMMAVTYIPRLIPFAAVSSKGIPARLKSFLMFVPCAALGALIFPGVFFAIPQIPLAGIAGIIFAAAYSWYKGGIIIPVLGSIAVTFIVLLVNK